MKRNTQQAEPEEYLEKPKGKKQQRLDTKAKAIYKSKDAKQMKEDRWN